MAAARLLRASNPTRHILPSTTTAATASPSLRAAKCVGKMGFGGEKIETAKSSTVAPLKAAAAVASSSGRSVATESQVEIDAASLLATLYNALVKLPKKLSLKRRRRQKKVHLQSLLERVVVDCRFFAMFAVAGSLLGSVLCFVEGCFLVMESYLQYFNAISTSSDNGQMMHLLIEAIDMFLVGTAMLIFGVGLYIMFVGTKTATEKRLSLPRSSFFGLFHLKSLPAWVEMESVSEAKSKIGHAIMMILQVGLLDKFKTVPLVTSLDLACFAGAVLVSSACIFLPLKTFRRQAVEDNGYLRDDDERKNAMILFIFFASLATHLLVFCKS